jgi:hypothetical protein
MTWPTWLTHNPLAWVALANGLIDAAITFGAPITDPEKLAIGTVLGLISVLFVQSQVTSTAKLSSLGVIITPVAQAATVIPIFQPTIPTPPLPLPTTVVPPQVPPV